MQNRYIKLYRKSLENPLFQKPLLWHYFLYCLFKANHCDKKIIWNKKELTIERGSFITGREQAAKESGLTAQNIRSAQESLINLAMIEKSTSKSTSKFTYITICNYDKYQEFQPASNQQSNQQVTSNQPASNQQVTTTKNDNNDKNYKNEKKEPKSFSSDSNEIRLSELLLNLIRQRNPNHKQPNIQGWAKDIDRMIRLDKRPVDEVERVLKWCQTDFFWKNNILSTSALREKFDQLALKMNSTKGGPTNGRFTGLDEKDYHAGTW